MSSYSEIAELGRTCQEHQRYVPPSCGKTDLLKRILFANNDVSYMEFLRMIVITAKFYHSCYRFHFLFISLQDICFFYVEM